MKYSTLIQTKGFQLIVSTIIYVPLAEFSNQTKFFRWPVSCLRNLQASIFVKKVFSKFYLLSGTSIAGGSQNKPKVFYIYKYELLKKFAKFRGEHLHRSVCCNKVACWRLAILCTAETLSQMFSSKFCEVFKNTYFVGQL